MVDYIVINYKILLLALSKQWRALRNKPLFDVKIYNLNGNVETYTSINYISIQDTFVYLEQKGNKLSKTVRYDGHVELIKE